MSDLVRDAALGFTLRTITRGKLFTYPEDSPDFRLPDTYNTAYKSAGESHPRDMKQVLAPADKIVTEEKLEEPEIQSIEETVSHDTSTDSESIEDLEPIKKIDTVDPYLNLEKVHTQADLERALTAATSKRTQTRPVIPTRTADGVIVVDWYTTDDPANPQNWSFAKKAFVTFQICLYTMAVYMGSSIYTASESDIIEIFGVSQTVASLGLALYVLGYGTGPLVFSPLSEIPIVGRNPPYIVTFAIFVLLLIPSALVNNVPGLLVLRFLQGFFGSPCLATSGATIGDMYNILQLPFLMTIWVSAAVAGPSLGPLISGFSVVATDWHWSMWELLWLSGPTFILLFLTLPETSAQNILLRRAVRLRKLTGNMNLQSQSEIDQSKLSASTILVESLLRPAQITVQDPAVLFATIYSSLTYAIYYSFFESFPLVFIGMHGFNMGQLGLTFLSITVGVSIAITSYFFYLSHYVNPRIRAQGLGAPEMRLIPSLLTSTFVPIGLFIFAWTSSASIHWIAPLIGVGIYNMGVFIVFQCIFMYIPLSYPQYAASLFAANDFSRSALSFAAILFATPMFKALGVARGVTLLAGFTLAGIPGIWALYYWGPSLRARSKFTVKA